MRRVRTVYVVLGPSWEGGARVLGYATSPREVRAMLRREYGPLTWEGAEDRVEVFRAPARELGWDGSCTLEEFVELLNSKG